MAKYVVLMNWTEQGVKTYKDTVDRYEAVREIGGVRFVDIYWTAGQYDLVGIVEAPDGEALAAALLQVGAAGNLRTSTMRAFDADEMRGVIARATG
jgi:uncharacterized protein with GYD domain